MADFAPSNLSDMLLHTMESTPVQAPATLDETTLEETMSHHWGLFLLEGILLVLLGMAALAMPALASVAAAALFGWVLLLSGVMGLISTLRARRAPGFVWSLLSAILGVAAGAVLLWSPLRGTLSLTAVLIAFLVVEGVVSVFYGLEHRKALSGRWGWMVASGIIDVLLAALLYLGLPGSALWALGILLGINLLFGGWALIWMALHARSQSTSSAAGSRRL
jgi:uncharacterized membrane protein HdeD (DUF308 family)